MTIIKARAFEWGRLTVDLSHHLEILIWTASGISSESNKIFLVTGQVGPWLKAYEKGIIIAHKELSSILSLSVPAVVSNAQRALMQKIGVYAKFILA